jgi:hypothetical protein
MSRIQVVASLIVAAAHLGCGFRLAFANRVKSGASSEREIRSNISSIFVDSDFLRASSGSLHDGVHDIREARSENQLVVRKSSQPLALKGPPENQLVVYKDGESSQRQIILVDSRLRSSRGSDELDELLTMGSMVSSNDEIDSIEDLRGVELVESHRGKALAFNKGSGALELQPANVVKMHLITTQVVFLPGNLKYGKKSFPDNELMAKKYGEAVKSREVCNTLAGEIKDLQATAPTGSKFVICVSLGTSATEAYLKKQERPDFALNRATNVKTCLEEALEAAGLETPVKDPMVQYKKHRVAVLLMKSYKGEDEPACIPSEITIPAAV